MALISFGIPKLVRFAVLPKSAPNSLIPYIWYYYTLFGRRDAVRVAGLFRKTSVRGRQERLSAVAGLLSGPHHLRCLLARIGVEPLDMVLTDKCDHAKPGRL